MDYYRWAAKAQRTQRKRWLVNALIAQATPLMREGDIDGAAALCASYGTVYDQVLEQERLEELHEAREA